MIKDENPRVFLRALAAFQNHYQAMVCTHKPLRLMLLRNVADWNLVLSALLKSPFTIAW